MSGAENHYMGYPVSQWRALQDRFEHRDDFPQVMKLLGEILQLRGKVSYYESRIKELASQMQNG